MELEMVFAILGIEQTKDKKLIQGAYRTKLVDNNPEDHPEEFMRLRQAYEEALAYADSEDEEKDEEEDDTPVGKWMARVKAAYRSISKRRDVDVWKELLSDQVCFDLEYSQEARKRLFIFLMDNFRLPVEIYVLLDEKLGIEANQDELNEFLPVQFVDYMIREIHTEVDDDFSFEWLEGPDGADFDFVIRNINEIYDLMPEELSKARELIDAIRNTGVSHPYLDSFEALYLAHTGEGEKAIKLAQKTFEQTPDSLRVELYAAETLYLAGDKENAIKTFKKLGDKYSLSYAAEKYLALYEFANGNYVEAMDHCGNASDINASEEILDLSKQIDLTYIEKSQDNIKKDTMPTDQLEEILKTLLRQNMADKALEYVERCPHVLEDIPYGQSFMSDIYYCAQRFMEAASAGDNYAKKLAEIEDDSVEYHSALDRNAYYTSQAYIEMANAVRGRRSKQFIDKFKEFADTKSKDGFIAHSYTDEVNDFFNHWDEYISVKHREEIEKADEVSKDLYASAKAVLKAAVEKNPNSFGTFYGIIRVDMYAHNFEEALEECDMLLEKMPDQYQILLYKQQACYELGKAQEVIDLYDKCRSIYEGSPLIYEYAAKVFLDYSQLDDAQRTIDAARESGITDPIIDILEYKLQVKAADSEESLADLEAKVTIDPLPIMKKLLDSENRYQNSEKIAELFEAMGMNKTFRLCFYEKEDDDGEEDSSVIPAEDRLMDLFYMLHASSVSWNPVDYYYFLGYTCGTHDSYINDEMTLLYYDMYLQKYKDHIPCRFKMGCILCEDRKVTEGLTFLDEVARKAPDFRDVIRRTAYYMFEAYHKTGMAKYLYRALELAKQQVESKNADAFDIYKYASIQMEVGNYQEAISWAKKLFGDKDFDSDAYIITGKCLRYQGKYAESVRCFRNGLKVVKPDEQAKFYENLMEVVRSGFGFQDVENLYQETVRKNVINGSILSDYLDALEIEDKYEEIIALIDKDLALGEDSLLNWKYAVKKKLITQREMAVIKGHGLDLVEQDIEKYYNEKPADDSKDTLKKRLAQEVAEYYAYEEGNFARALGYELKYLELVKDTNTYHDPIYYKTGRNTVYDSQNPYHNALGAIINAVRYARLKNNSKDLQQTLDMFADALKITYDCEDVDQAIEAYTSEIGWMLNNSINALEYYISCDNRAKADEYFKKINTCQHCTHCYGHRDECNELDEPLAIYYEYIGDYQKAYEHYCKDADYTKDICLSYYKLKELKNRDDIDFEAAEKLVKENNNKEKVSTEKPKAEEGKLHGLWNRFRNNK